MNDETKGMKLAKAFFQWDKQSFVQQQYKQTDLIVLAKMVDNLLQEQQKEDKAE